MEKKKDDMRRPVGASTYDICLCAAKCKTPCGRKGKPVEPIYTAADFTDECLYFEPCDKAKKEDTL